MRLTDLGKSLDELCAAVGGSEEVWKDVTESLDELIDYVKLNLCRIRDISCE